MHKSVIRLYVRQILLEGEDSPGTVTKISNTVDAGNDSKLGSLPEFLKKSIAGKRFSLTDEGEPAFVVIADNLPQQKVVIRPYSVFVKIVNDKEKLKDEEEQNAFSTPMRLAGIELAKTLPIQKLNEERDFNLIGNIGQNQGSWELYPAYEETFWKDVSDASKLSGDIDSLYLMPRKAQYLLPPRKIATVSGYSRVENFECSYSFVEALSISVSYELTDPQWSLAAACYYSYANDPIPNVAAMAVGALIGFFLGGPPGAWVGAGIVATLWDVGFRFIVCKWAAANAKYEFLAVNALWIVVCVLFETLTNYKAFKESLRVGVALAEVGLDPGVKTMKAINVAEYLETYVNTAFKESGFAKTWELVPKTTQDEVLAKAAKIFSEELEVGVVREGYLTKEAVEKAFSEGPWKMVCLVLTNLIVTGLAGYVGQKAAESCREAILAELDKPESWNTKLSDSEAEMIKIVKRAYPPI